MSRRLYIGVLAIVLFLELIALNGKINTATSTAQVPTQVEYAIGTLNLTITYRGLDVRERVVLLGIMAEGIGIGRDYWSHNGEAMGWVHESWGTDLSDFKIPYSRVTNDKFSTVFNFEASFGLDSKMLFYPHDLHETWFGLTLSGIVFNSTNHKVNNFMADFDMMKTEVTLTNSESATFLRFECLLQRKIWAQAYLSMPNVAFFVALLFVPFIKSKKEEWFSVRLTVMLAIITFASLNLWGIYGTIQHSFYGPSILEFNLYTILALCTYTFIYSVVDRYVQKKPRSKKIRLVVYFPFFIPFLYWVYHCFIDPALMFSDLTNLGKSMLVPSAIVSVALPVLLILFGLPEESSSLPKSSYII